MSTVSVHAVKSASAVAGPSFLQTGMIWEKHFALLGINLSPKVDLRGRKATR